jgi:hypothetical protein
MMFPKLFAFSLITIATAKHDYVRQTKFGTENVAGWLNETQDAVQGTTSNIKPPAYLHLLYNNSFAGLV